MKPAFHNFKTTTVSGKRRGVALIIVLGFLVLLTGLIVAFFVNISTERASASAYANGVSTRYLSESAVQVVMGTIQRATTRGANVAWASQPGMIRTYGSSSGGVSAAPLAYYKLYSSENMEVTASQTASYEIAADVDGQWDAKPAMFADLNAPVLDSEGKLHFPIIDPRIQTTEGTAMVDGFSYSDTVTLANGNSTKVNNTITAGGDSQRLPMPVKWIYVLKDGSLTAPTGVEDSGMKAKWDGLSSATKYKAPSSENPIVGRIAFWTDDECSKVNINTASEGVYWDVPRLMSLEDYGKNPYTADPTYKMGMALSQPVQREYNRYPGHPACTSLSPIFGSANWNPPLLPVPSPYPVNPVSTDAEKLDPYYNLAPRIGLAASAGGGSGGSKGGSYLSSNTAEVMTTDTDRLYASVDELMFTPRLSGAARIPNTSTTALPQTITKDVLEKTRFFLTVSSSAPETTVFNTPRVSMWPVWNDAAKHTAADKLLTFCSTIGGRLYGFTRSDARSTTADYNLTAPDGTKRNQILYAYLQRMTGKGIPGFGGNFLSKYATNGLSDRDQILTYIYDYIRCTSAQDKSAGATPYTPIFVFNAKGEIPGAGEIAPIKIGPTQGFGRFYSVSSANLFFYGTHKNSAGKTDRMRAVLMLVPTTPYQGIACTRGNLKYTVTGLDGMLADGNSLKLKPGGTNYIDTSGLNFYGGRGLGGTEEHYLFLSYTNTSNGTTAYKSFDKADAGGDAHYKYPFFSEDEVDVSTTDAQGKAKTYFDFTSTKEIVVQIRAADTNELFQTLHFNFPGGRFRTPVTNVDSSGNPVPLTNRLPGKSPGPLGTSDTVVALEVGGSDLNANASIPGQAVDNTAGDIRMVAGLGDVKANRYRAQNNYTDANVSAAHHMGSSGGKFGKLAIGVANSTGLDIPSRVATGASRIAASGGPGGDWDTGWGDLEDGAYINKPDEGDTKNLVIKTGFLYMPYSTGYNEGWASANSTYFSPNRMIPSPLMFGSIPTGVQRMQPWQTLLFHPRPEDPSHPGNGTPANPPLGTSYSSPPDHLIADLFWMPVVEPYAISQPFSTSGKINLNYQIAPFTNIKRATGIHAVMKSTKFAAIPVTDAGQYKNTIGFTSGNPTYIPNRRRNIDMNKTLIAFEEKFKNNDLFRSASQICEIDLVPPEVSLSSTAKVSDIKSTMASFWNNNRLTGDNLREKPYVDLYSRLTTKSNAYTVHYRVQVLKKSRNSDATVWDENRDTVVSEQRGSSIIERYVDAGDTTLPDFATDSTKNLDAYYKFRVLSTKKFTP